MTFGELLGLVGMILGGFAILSLTFCTTVAAYVWLYSLVLRRRRRRARPGYVTWKSPDEVTWDPSRDWPS